MEVIIGLLPIILTNNVLMSGVKWLANKSLSSAWLRAFLVFFSLLGVLASATITGEPIDFGQVSDLTVMALTAICAALASHLSYKAIKGA